MEETSFLCGPFFMQVSVSPFESADLIILYMQYVYILYRTIRILEKGKSISYTLQDDIKKPFTTIKAAGNNLGIFLKITFTNIDILTKYNRFQLMFFNNRVENIAQLYSGRWRWFSGGNSRYLIEKQHTALHRCMHICIGGPKILFGKISNVI